MKVKMEYKMKMREIENTFSIEYHGDINNFLSYQDDKKLSTTNSYNLVPDADGGDDIVNYTILVSDNYLEMGVLENYEHRINITDRGDISWPKDNLINNIYDEKNKGPQNVTRIANYFYPKYNNYNHNNYINFSVNCSNVEIAVVTRMVLGLLDEQILLLPERSPGSILGHSVSTIMVLENSFKQRISYSDDNINQIK